ncbi:predicted protein, partial [Nematostella vectensis]
VVLTLGSMLTSYIVAFIHGHVYPFMPAVSDTGVLSPEKYIFRELNNLASFLFIATCFVRYMQYQIVAEQCREESVKLSRLNKLTFGIGTLSGVSMTFVANFEIQKTVSFHDVGAVSGFSGALVYCWLQTLMSYRLRDHGVINSTAVCHTRTMLSTIMTLTFIIFLGFQAKSHWDWDRVRPNYHFLAKLHWGPEDPGYVSHVISNLSEWSYSAAFLLFVLTFLTEFKSIRI